jgi:hypothetical protein
MSKRRYSQSPIALGLLKGVANYAKQRSDDRKDNQQYARQVAQKSMDRSYDAAERSQEAHLQDQRDDKNYRRSLFKSADPYTQGRMANGLEGSDLERQVAAGGVDHANDELLVGQRQQATQMLNVAANLPTAEASLNYLESIADQRGYEFMRGNATVQAMMQQYTRLKEVEDGEKKETAAQKKFDIEQGKALAFLPAMINASDEEFDSYLKDNNKYFTTEQARTEVRNIVIARTNKAKQPQGDGQTKSYEELLVKAKDKPSNRSFVGEVDPERVQQEMTIHGFGANGARGDSTDVTNRFLGVPPEKPIVAADDSSGVQRDVSRQLANTGLMPTANAGSNPPFSKDNYSPTSKPSRTPGNWSMLDTPDAQKSAQKAELTSYAQQKGIELSPEDIEHILGQASKPGATVQKVLDQLLEKEAAAKGGMGQAATGP